MQTFARLQPFLFLVAGSTVAAALSSCTSVPNVGTTDAVDIPQYPSKPVCPTVRKPGGVRCLAHIRTDAQGKPAVSAGPTSGYGPAQIHSAYNLPATGGAGQTVALVDAYDDPNAESDLAAYRAQFGLPACTTANGCFRKVNQSGQQGNYPGQDPENDWPGETSLDLDAVSAACPGCNILLVEANDDDMANLGTANNAAATLGATVISNSWGGAEDSTDTSVQKQYFTHPGILITASSGDDGYGTFFPASSPLVLGVGGTSLVQASATARGWTETAWSNGGSGCSTLMTKPAWQTDTACRFKTVADVSADADPNTGLAVYQSGWEVIGGTSEASPLVAAIFALTGKAAVGASFPYANRALFNDITSGSNGNCSGSYLCTAGVGYDGPTGVGTPNASLWVTDGGTPPDAGTSDAGTSDAGTSDAGRPDTGTDAGPPNEGGARDTGSDVGQGEMDASAADAGPVVDTGSGEEDGTGSGGRAAPTVALLSPGNGASLPAYTQLSVSAQIDSSVDLAQVLLSWNMPNGQVIVDCANPPINTTCTVDHDIFTWSFLGTTGSRTWSVSATDTEGNTTQSPLRSLSFVDQGQPTVTILAPTAGTSYSPSDIVQVVVEASGPSGISQVGLTWTPPPGSGAGPTQYALTYWTGNEWYTNLPPILSTAVSGARLLTVTATDPKGATSTAEVTVEVQ